MQVTAAKRFLKLRAGVNSDGVTSHEDVQAFTHDAADLFGKLVRAVSLAEVRANTIGAATIAANLPNDGFGLGRCAATVHQDLGTPLG